MSRLVASHGASRGGPSTSGTDTVTGSRGPNYTTPGDSPVAVPADRQVSRSRNLQRWRDPVAHVVGRACIDVFLVDAFGAVPDDPCGYRVKVPRVLT